MNITFERNPETKKLEAAYIYLDRGVFASTMEVVDGECFVDMDSDGKFLGVELLFP